MVLNPKLILGLILLGLVLGTGAYIKYLNYRIDVLTGELSVAQSTIENMTEAKSAVERRLKEAEERAQQTRVITRTKIQRIRDETPTTCEQAAQDAVQFAQELRREREGTK